VRACPQYYFLVSDIRSALTVPVKLKNEVVATIHVESTRLSAFSQRHLDLLTSVADQAVVVIEMLGSTHSGIGRFQLSEDQSGRCHAEPARDPGLDCTRSSRGDAR